MARERARTMLDINLFREEKGNDPEIIRESQRRRFADVDLVDEVINLDKEWRQRQFEVDGLRTEFNKLNKQVAKLKISGADASEVIQQAEKNKQDAADKEKEVGDAYAKLKEKLVKVGNLVPDSVPVSNDEPVFAPGQKVMNHVDLVEKTFIADNRRGAEIAGGRGYFLRGHGVLLNQALINFGLQFLRKRKFTPFQPPFLMRKDVMAKSAQLSEFDEQLYKVTGKGKDKDVTGEGDGKYLIATAEQPLCAYHMDEWIPLKELPIRYAGYSTCFRTEAGSHGRDQLGLFRVHQFEKIEQFCITSPDENDSWEMLEEMMKNSEEFYRELKLPYRVVEIVSGALNDAAAKKYDLEGWFPASGTYRELVSCSNCTDYQARRLEIRYGHKKSNEETKYVHMLNSTLTATERTICCILENYQREDRVEVPEVLLRFMDGVTDDSSSRFRDGTQQEGHKGRDDYRGRVFVSFCLSFLNEGFSNLERLSPSLNLILQFQMAAASPNSPVRIVVIGDKGTGKSSLIVAAATDSFPPNVPPVLPDTKLPFQFFPDGIPVTIVDTSSRPEDKGMVAEELKLADAVVLTYDCDRPETLERLSTYWLPELRLLEVKVPIIVAGCKLDLRDDNSPVVLEEVMAPIMHQFREIETCIECSALKQLQAQEVFYYAQKTVIHPTAPLFDQETQTLKPRCVRALKRIFILCDHDKDGALSEAELNAFQVKCFHAPLQPSEVDGVKRVVQEKLPEGVNEVGLTLTGFLFLHALFIEKGRLETTWTVLRKFGYNNDIRLADELLPPSLFKRAPDQDNNLKPQEIEDLFSTAPESPWKEAPYEGAAEKTALGGLSSDSFLSLWSLMTLLEPARSVEHLIYIGFQGDPSSAIRFTRKRLLDRKKKQCERKVVQCFVFGPNSAGKSALLNCFLGRSYADNTESTTDERYAVNVVDETKSAKKTLVMREIPADGAHGILSSKESLAACDIAVFVYDSSDESSWKRASELLVEVANHGEATGYEVPCLMVSAKDDIVSSQIPIQDSTRVTQDMGIEPPVSISSKLGDFNNLFGKIVTAAQHPHLNIPETEAGKSRRHYNRLINRSLLSLELLLWSLGWLHTACMPQERALLPEKIENEELRCRISFIQK
ncbi:hypothetical protein HID58_031917 [Brassica napus]|uniref:serine--tRNA ligase n=1 Tax=Brassica napus TaxID=3708 RepID=A0ABQ8BUU6_BRANA|nr:hypothetical protein HID58_031917 [Brassica napus]